MVGIKCVVIVVGVRVVVVVVVVIKFYAVTFVDGMVHDDVVVVVVDVTSEW